MFDPSGRHRQLTPPTRRRQPAPPSPLRQATPPSHSAKSPRQVTPPSHPAKLLRQLTLPTCSEHWLRLDRSRGSTAIPQTLAGDGLALRTSPGTRGRTPPNSPVSGDFGHRPGSPLFQLTDDPRNSIPDFQMAPRENQSQEPPTHASVTLNPRCHSLLTETSTGTPLADGVPDTLLRYTNPPAAPPGPAQWPARAAGSPPPPTATSANQLAVVVHTMCGDPAADPLPQIIDQRR
jgi:hypothetical protein